MIQKQNYARVQLSNFIMQRSHLLFWLKKIKQREYIIHYPPPIHFNEPFCRLNALNAGVGDLLFVLAMAIVLLRSASHRATIVV